MTTRLVIHAGAVTQSRKSEYRQRLRQQRSEELPELSLARSERFLDCAEQLLDLASGPIAGFQPTNGEPDISPLLRTLATKTTVFLPRPTGDVLGWLAADRSQLVGNLTGIPQPEGPILAVGAQIVTKLNVQLILVPALAVDPASATRLGYGAGFYDRLFAEIRDQSDALAVGVCRDDELVELPNEPHDQAMNAVLTESGLRHLPLSQ